MINKSRLLQTLYELVEIDSPSGDEEAVALKLKGILVGLGVDTDLDSYGNLVGRFGSGNPILLSAHMDTVEPGRGIKPQIDGDRVISSGTTILGGDCKAGIAAIIEGITSLSEEGVSPKPFEIAFTRQEEIGLVGARNLDFSKLTAKEAIVFDGEGPVTQITSSSPTHVRFEIAVTGRAAHAGVEPEKGVSAILVASELVVRLPQGRLDDSTTFNIGVIEGGSVTNAVPEKANLKGEFRSHNKDTLSDITGILTKVSKEVRDIYPEAIIDLELYPQFEAYSVMEGDLGIDRVVDAMGKLGLTHTLLPSGGGTDGNIFRLNGISAAVVGMADHNAHTTREYVSIPELVDAARLCEQLLKG